MASDKYKKASDPTAIRVISLAWMPPVTMLVNHCFPNTTSSEIADLTRETWPFDEGRYHVWKGELVNVDSFAKRFGGRDNFKTKHPAGMHKPFNDPRSRNHP